MHMEVTSKSMDKATVIYVDGDLTTTSSPEVEAEASPYSYYLDAVNCMEILFILSLHPRAIRSYQFPRLDGPRIPRSMKNRGSAEPFPVPIWTTRRFSRNLTMSETASISNGFFRCTVDHRGISREAPS